MGQITADNEGFGAADFRTKDKMHQIRASGEGSMLCSARPASNTSSSRSGPASVSPAAWSCALGPKCTFTQASSKTTGPTRAAVSGWCGKTWPRAPSAPLCGGREAAGRVDRTAGVVRSPAGVAAGPKEGKGQSKSTTRQQSHSRNVTHGSHQKISSQQPWTGHTSTRGNGETRHHPKMNTRNWMLLTPPPRGKGRSLRKTLKD